MLPLKFKSFYVAAFKDHSESCISHLILMAVLGIIISLRRPDALLNAQPWAEDGSIFIQQAIDHSFSSLFIPYAGYFHTIPRLVTQFSLQFGLQNAPFIMNFLSLLIAIYCISYFFDIKFRFIVQDDYLRFVSAILIVLLPIQEIFLNITNIQWFLSIYLTLWSTNMIFNYESMFKNRLNVKTTSQMLFTGLAFLSTPLSFFLIPFIIWILLRKIKHPNFSSPNFLILYLVPVIIGLFHIIACISLDTQRDTATPSLINLVRIFSQVVTKVFYSNSHEIVAQFGYGPSYLISIFVISILILAAYNKKHIVVDMWLWALIILDILFIGISTPNYSGMFSSYNVSGGERYLFYPITWLLVLFVRHFNTFDRSKLKYIIYVCLAIFFINMTLNYELQPFEDLNFKSYASDFDSNGQFTCVIPINPNGWFMSVSCNPHPMPNWHNFKNVKGGIMAIDMVDNRLYSNESEVVHIDKKANQYIELTGWAADDLSEDGNVNTYLVFKNENDEIIVPTRKTYRPDVAIHFGVESYKDSGWTTMIQTRDFKNECFNISLRISRTNGREYYELNGDKPVCFS